jgi:TetR/AcrR family transcriptional regulator, tetracycline repressor protein
MSRKSRPSREALSSEAIVRLAIEQAAARGIEHLSMRKLAAALGVTPMALYWHFASRDALLDAMAEHVAGKIVYDDDPSAPWQDRLRGVLTALLSLFRRHPWLGPLARRRIVPAPNFLRALEILLDSVRTAGYDQQASVYVIDFAIDGLAAMANQLAGVRSMTTKPPPPSAGQLDMREQLLGLAGYPRIREAAVPLTTSEAPALYTRLGIDILVAGIETSAPRKRRDS